jgi:putative endonuclease
MASHPSLMTQAKALTSSASSRHRQAKDVHRSSLSIRRAKVDRKDVGVHPRGSSISVRNRSFRFRVAILRSSSSGAFPRGKGLAGWVAMSKRFVYVIRNQAIRPKYYTGLTSDVARRVSEHNTGRCSHTADHGPWSVDVAIEFADERRAVTFEQYLKSGSGVAFAQRHLR